MNFCVLNTLGGYFDAPQLVSLQGKELRKIQHPEGIPNIGKPTVYTDLPCQISADRIVLGVKRPVMVYDQQGRLQGHIVTKAKAVTVIQCYQGTILDGIDPLAWVGDPDSFHLLGPGYADRYVEVVDAYQRFFEDIHMTNRSNVVKVLLLQSPVFIAWLSDLFANQAGLSAPVALIAAGILSNPVVMALGTYGFDQTQSATIHYLKLCDLLLTYDAMDNCGNEGEITVIGRRVVAVYTHQDTVRRLWYFSLDQIISVTINIILEYPEESEEIITLPELPEVGFPMLDPDYPQEDSPFLLEPTIPVDEPFSWHIEYQQVYRLSDCFALASNDLNVNSLGTRFIEYDQLLRDVANDDRKSVDSTQFIRWNCWNVISLTYPNGIRTYRDLGYNVETASIIVRVARDL